MKTKLLAPAASLLLAIAALPAMASFHLIKVVEIFPGTPAEPFARYIVIQMYASGQQFVGGQSLTVFDAAGTQIGTFRFPANVSNGANQAKILIATSTADRLFQMNADLHFSDCWKLVNFDCVGWPFYQGGKVCWAGTADCAAWGAYSGSASGVGTPFNPGENLQLGMAVKRRLDITGSTAVLDAGDDTDDCANDFVYGLPLPQNNAGNVGRVVAATCGNGLLEGLEGCDDGNLADRDGCSRTCTAEEVVTRRVSEDFSGDGISDLFWRNTSTGRNVIWRYAKASSQQSVVGVSNLDWKVVGIGDFDGDALADVFWRNSSTGANVIWRSAIASTQLAVASVGNVAWHVAGIGDFDGDGRANAAQASMQQSVATVASPNWRVARVGDFDGGKSDIFWRNISTGANVIWTSADASTQHAAAAVTDLAWIVIP